MSWFAAACQQEVVYVDDFQPYQKQQLSSRMLIRASNRVLPLSIPVVRRGLRLPLCEKQISYAEDWPRHHWRSLVSAYHSTPYFEYYEDRLKELYESPGGNLGEFLKETLQYCWKTLQMPAELRFTGYSPALKEVQRDYRFAFDPTGAQQLTGFTALPYTQAFDGFVGGLTILDLLFSQGPESRPRFLTPAFQD